MKREFKVQVGTETIDAVIFSKNGEKPNFVFLHGAGTGNKDRINNYTKSLLEAGVSILAFDFSGHGASSGRLNESSLAKRILEARAMIEKYCDPENLTVCGSSMGGYVALKMLEFFKVKNLILFCPGVYDSQAYNLVFNDEFSKVIRRPESWKNTDITSSLQKFQGQLLVIIGEKDDVIPPGVIELIERYSPQASHKEIIRIPEAVHMIHAWLARHESEKGKVITKLIEYSRS